MFKKSFYCSDRCDSVIGVRQLNIQTAFTLIELLVVIAIIAILAAILLPVLAAAKGRALEAQCINNTKELQIGWILYATDNQDYMVPNCPYIVGSPPPSSEIWCPNQNSPQAAMNWTTDVGNTNIAVFSNTIMTPYMSGQMAIYRCPADNVPSKNGQRVRSYSMQGQVGNLYCKARTQTLNQHGIPYTKVSDLHSAPGPADTIVFLEEHPNSLLNMVFDGYLEVDSSGGTFSDIPGSNHKWNCGMSFADGHSEMHKWITPTLRIPVVANAAAISGVSAGTLNTDWYWFTTHCSGTQ